MDKLWAPWRSKFIYLRKRKGCIFCQNRKNAKPHKYVVERTAHSFSVLNIYPYNNGHIMVAPYRHVKDIDSLSQEEMADLFDLVRSTLRLISKRLKPHGYNVGMNIGKVSGAGYPGHLHVHIVPRWYGDTNFMPVVSDTKIVSESLDAVYKTLTSKR